MAVLPVAMRLVALLLLSLAATTLGASSKSLHSVTRRSRLVCVMTSYEDVERRRCIQRERERGR
jgi:hypothetical protein